MNNRRAKLAAGATVLGLGALGGVALGTNPGPIPATAQQAAGNNPARVVTSTSGATSTAGQPVAVQAPANTRAPIVTGASGAGSVAPVTSDD